MKLILHHISCYTYQVFELPDTGTVFLMAPSGYGKSSICRAIWFALFGDGPSIIQYGYKSCQVELFYRNLYISRTKGPGRLQVSISGETLEDDEAQAYLTQWFFPLIGTVSQDSFLHKSFRSKRAFLELSVNDQLAFLRELSGGAEIQQWKDRLKLYSKNQNQLIQTTQMEIEHYQTRINELGTIVVPDPPYHATKQSIIQSIEKHKSTIQTHQQSIRTLQNQIQQAYTYREQHARILEQQQRIQQSIEIFQQKYTDIQQQLCPALYRKWMEYKCALKEYSIYQNKRTQWNKELETIETKLEEFPWLDELQEQQQQYYSCKEYKKQYKQIQTNLQHLVPIIALEEQIQTIENQLADHITCPSCQTELINYEGNVQIAQVSSQTARISLTGKERTTLKQNLQSLKQKQSQYEHLTTEKQRLKTLINEISTDYDPNAHETVIGLEQQKKRLEQLIQNQNIVTEPDIFAADEECIHKHERAMQQEPEIRKELNHYKQQLKPIPNNVQSLETIEKWNHTLQQNTLDMQEQQDHLAYLEQCKLYETYREYNAHLNQLEIDVKTAITQIEASQQLNQLVSDAESNTLQTVIETINVHLQSYLDAFFTEDPMTIYIYMGTKERKKKSLTNDLPQLMVETYYKNNPIAIDHLSTGEYDRVQLAFQLTFSEIQHHPFVILDECVSSLDADTANQVLDCLGHRCSDQLVILIAHQLVTGRFTQIIDLVSLRSESSST